MTILPAPYDTTFLTFFFVYVRVSVVIFTMPVLGNRTVSRPIRAGIAFWVTMVLIGHLMGLSETSEGLISEVERGYDGLIDFAIAVAGEVVIGLVLGFIGQILLHTIGIAGEIIGQQAGFSAASVFDPITGQDIFLMAQINTWIGTLVFLIIGGPEIVISVLADSFKILKPGEGFPIDGLAEGAWEVMLFSEGRRYAMGTIMYKVGVQIAAPLAGSMILISVAEAFMARTVPQLNIMAVGFAIRISMSLLILLGMFQYSTITFKHHLLRYQDYAYAFLQRMSPF